MREEINSPNCSNIIKSDIGEKVDIFNKLLDTFSFHERIRLVLCAKDVLSFIKVLFELTPSSIMDKHLIIRISKLSEVSKYLNVSKIGNHIIIYNPVQIKRIFNNNRDIFKNLENIKEISNEISKIVFPNSILKQDRQLLKLGLILGYPRKDMEELINYINTEISAQTLDKGQIQNINDEILGILTGVKFTGKYLRKLENKAGFIKDINLERKKNTQKVLQETGLEVILRNNGLIS